jgi:VWFA-related protein
MSASLRLSLAVLLCFPLFAMTQQPVGPAGNALLPAAAPAVPSAAVAARPAAAVKGRLHLDVMVTDKAGKPVSGLTFSDFALLDENHPGKIVSFEKGNDPAEVILVIDMVNLGEEDVLYMRQELQRFLRQNDGHLERPVSIFVFTPDGVRMRPGISDGNQLAAELEKLAPVVRPESLTTGAGADISRFQLSLKWASGIIRAEAARPGRKLLIWCGPGWPAVDGPDYSIAPKTLDADFRLIVDLSKLMREGQVSLYSVSALLAKKVIPSSAGMEPPHKGTNFNWAERDYNNDSGPFAYKQFLKGVRTSEKAFPAHLQLPVLAVQSGGLVLGPDKDVVSQISKCIQDAGASYRLSFDPPATDHANEYHEIKVAVAQKDLVVRTAAGYYDQP